MKFPAALAPGSATLRLQFTGVLNDKMRGFYRTKYAVAGEERWAAVTQFEATDGVGRACVELRVCTGDEFEDVAPTATSDGGG